MTEIPKDKNRDHYRNQVRNLGKKEFTFLKMQEYGFWPKELPTPYERQEQETKEEYEKRKQLIKEYQRLSGQISKMYEEVTEIDAKLRDLRSQYDATWDYEKIRQDVARRIMKESIERRAKRKAEKEEEKRLRREAWDHKKAKEIVFIGKGYSSHLVKKETNTTQLKKNSLPLIETDRELAALLGLSYKELRFLVYHRDVLKKDHYYRYEIPKKNGGVRKIAAPKAGLKKAQHKILTEILEKLSVSPYAHGFLKSKSVVTGAKTHATEPELVINMDLENFFPTITYVRVRGLFEGFGYSGYIASLLAMICTYCERMELEIKGEVCYVKTSDRILPQGSPASPMITNVICRQLDYRIAGLAKKYEYVYSRYADDMSFTLEKGKEVKNIGSFLFYLTKIIEQEGFHVNTSKTRLIRKSQCQSITGVVINGEQIGVSSKWVKNFRSLLHHARKQLEEGSLSSETKNKISGRIAWLKSVNSERYQKIIEEGQTIISFLQETD